LEREEWKDFNEVGHHGQNLTATTTSTTPTVTMTTANIAKDVAIPSGRAMVVITTS